MADADEDAFPSQNPNHKQDAEASDSDGDSDAAPDYSLLSTISKKHALPSRGIKDFEPAPTVRQANSLDSSRKAMYDALSVIRVHNNRDLENIAVYFPDSADWDGARYEEAALLKVEDPVKRQKIRESSALGGEGRCVAVPKLTTTFTKTMGQQDRRGWSWLLPEEALFLLERGTLDIRYAGDEEGVADEDEAQGQAKLPIGDVPMSLQGAYAAFLGKSGLSLERYLVYSNLRRGGYNVRRAPTWYGPIDRTNALPKEHLSEPVTSGQVVSANTESGLMYRLFDWLFSSTPKPRTTPCFNSTIGPLLGPGLFRSYGDIYRQLQLIPTKQIPGEARIDAIHPEEGLVGDCVINSEDRTKVPLLLPTWLVHKPSSLSNYKKTAPPPPHYTVVVLDARHTFVPTSKQIGDLLAMMPEDLLPNEKSKRFENRIKYGKRHIMLAVVDSGLISYLRFSSNGFGPDNILWKENERRGQHRGSKGGGGFRGRGRGRGGRGAGRGRGR